jgi:threonine dehydrogenase-like Zn-dependent dehydrogenase
MLTSNAAVLTDSRVLEICSFPVPEVGAADGVIRVERNGLCGSDIDQYSGDLTASARPFIPGHEPVGTIVALGDEAASNWGVSVGDRVVVESPVPCMRCRVCRSGRTGQCRQQLRVGSTPISIPPTLFGGYSEYMYLHPNMGVHMISKDVPLDYAAMFNSLAGALEWTVKVGQVGLGMNVVILGSGQRGMACGIAAKAVGASTVIITGRSRSKAVKFPIALELGIDAAIDVDEEDVRQRVDELTGGELADVVINLVPNDPQALGLAIDLARPGGRIVVAALNSGRRTNDLDLDDIVLRELSIVGSWGRRARHTRWRSAFSKQAGSR